MRKRVVVTGLGCISPLGLNVEDTWKALLAGKSGAGPITRFDASQHKTKFAAEVKGFDPVALFGTREARKMDRFAQFAMASAMEAMAQACLKIDEANRDRVGVIIGTGIGGIGTMIENYEILVGTGPRPCQPVSHSDDDLGQRRRYPGDPHRSARAQYVAGHSLCDRHERPGRGGGNDPPRRRRHYAGRFVRGRDCPVGHGRHECNDGLIHAQRRPHRRLASVR